MLINKSYTTIALFVTFVVTILSFQNCAQNLDETRDNSSFDNDPNPIAFEVSVDHLAMMTCPTPAQSNAAEDNGYFTFKWGAYNNGRANTARKTGLSISENFLSQYEGYNKSKILEKLTNSKRNQGLTLASGFYRRNNFDNPDQTSGSGGELKIESANYPIDAYAPFLISDFSKSKAYFPNLSDKHPKAKKLLEGQISRPNNSSINAFNDDFSVIDEEFFSAKVLAIGFNHDGAHAANGIMASDGTYSGDGTGVHFQLGIGNSFGGIYRRTLDSVQEYNSIDGTRTNSEWSCPESLKFTIVRQEDLASLPFPCDPRAIEPSQLENLSASGNQDLRSLANTIDLGQWRVDLANKCIVRAEKAGSSEVDSCYDPKFYSFTIPQSDRVELDPGHRNFDEVVVDYSRRDCNKANSVVMIPDTDPPEETTVRDICPHVLSICVRTQ